MPQPAAQEQISRPSIAITAPLSPKSKASGKANIREPRAARHTMGASCQIRRRRWGRSSTSTSSPYISPGPGPSAATPSGDSSGPSGLRAPPSGSGPPRSAVPCSVLGAVSRGPASIATRPPN